MGSIGYGGSISRFLGGFSVLTGKPFHPAKCIGEVLSLVMVPAI